MAKTPTTQYVVKQGEGRFWQVFEGDNVRTSFDSQEDAVYWCDLNNLDYSVVTK